MSKRTAKTVFVTGGTGFIGMTLIERLLRRGERVKALTRTASPAVAPGQIVRDASWDTDARDTSVTPGNPWTHPQLTLVSGDVTDAESLRRGIEGCDEVYHLAGYANNWARDPSIFFRVNVDGVKNVVAAAREHGVRRVVWTSSIITLGPSHSRSVPDDEASPRLLPRCLTLYEEAKCQAESEVARYVADGAQIVTVNPTRVYGPGMLSESNSVARILQRYRHYWVLPYPNAGRATGNYVFVDDVVAGLILAMERGRIGERYVLGGDNASYAELFAAMDRLTGRYPLKASLWRYGPQCFATLLETYCRCVGGYPFITPGWVATFFADWTHSSAKAARELGYTTTSLNDGLERTWKWLKTH